MFIYAKSNKKNNEQPFYIKSVVSKTEEIPPRYIVRLIKFTCPNETMLSTCVDTEEEAHKLKLDLWKEAIKKHPSDCERITPDSITLKNGLSYYFEVGETTPCDSKEKNNLLKEIK